ncbi:hypothetical protein [Plantactinospora sp. GCM10030261]|uniref:hypothetical protein n=1 Tax=Plantactinospora sp. GCM10030261 TaxID=3273420 RepID=UPI00360A4A2E
MTTTRRIVAALLAAGGTAIGITVPAGPALATDPAYGSPCAMSYVPLPPGMTQVQIRDSDPSGRFQVGWAVDGAGREHLIRWDGGVPQDLGVTDVDADAINAHGDIVGSSYDYEKNHYSAWRYRDGRFTELPPLSPGHNATTHDLADDGTVVGTSSPVANRAGQPVVWSPEDVIRALAVPAGHDSGLITGIDADGTAVGSTFNRDPSAGSPSRAVRWAPDGSVTVLPAPPDGSGSGTSAVAIRNGHVIGAGRSDVDGADLALAWPPEATAPTVLAWGLVDAVNHGGSIALNTVPDGKLWLVHDDVFRSLPTDTSPFKTGGVVALTDDDVAYGYLRQWPVRWDCGPTP